MTTSLAQAGLYLLSIANLANTLPSPPPSHPHSTLSDPDQLNSARCVNTLYDYVIVGGGTAGLTVANRLSEDKNVSVLVVEYGHFDTNDTHLIPYYANFIAQRNMFNLTSTPQRQLGNRTFPVSIASTVGGGSVANGMYFDRGNRADYDAWEALGNEGWGWEGLLPYFIRSTNFSVPSREAVERWNYTWNPEVWGDEGPVKASLPDFQWETQRLFWDAFREVDVVVGGAERIGYPVEGNDGSGTGVIWVPQSQDPDGQVRSDARSAYYEPVCERENLQLITGTKVRKVVFRAGTKEAVGVEMEGRDDGIVTRVEARREVILAAGPVFSAHILHHSGIGPRAMLEEANITVIHDLPGVGMNLQDHPTAFMSYNFTKSTTPSTTTLLQNQTFNHLAQEEYFTSRTGPWIQAHGNSAAFLSLRQITSPSTANDIIQLLTTQDPTTHLPSIYDLTLRAGYRAQHRLLTTHLNRPDTTLYEFPFNGATSLISTVLLKPLSRGTITLNTTSPTLAPQIDYNTLSNPLDGHLLTTILNFTRTYFATPTLSQTLGAIELFPGPNLTSSPPAMAQVENFLFPSFSHQSGSCSMLPLELGGVVDADLRVYGVKGLSVVDSSIMPMIPSAHLCATVYAVAEKAADLIRIRHQKFEYQPL